ncbi:DUF3800 domain-containing protein [Luteipulveratus sp. YIM 133132]|uniref:DUF3800 domain-containing protein n=1 Tax=Luteipulveratus flavus TaxID=3031728 RepID=A0ABT6C6P2_9MICO|nr:MULTISPECIES: DUF3800 domain-containing protein [unclassified Luteipulveratus]MDE9365062.1 DUF3800 domain-containing protein [Luteipulveratus sp. YIM 133132]MDF8264603.1 DUF3800 domain-containing protein [Luteipulveratus sp. YIM 133296]
MGTVIDRPKVHVYVDETGDRGGSRESSPIFGMAAIVVDEAAAVAAREAVRLLRSDFKVPDSSVMSWKRHVKTHDRRRRAASVLAHVDGLRVCYVYALKSQLRSGSYRDDPQRFYNYLAFKTYKNSLWAARNMKGPEARVWTRFGHVRGHDHRTTEAYIRHQASLDPKVPFDMEQGLRWVSADVYLESQAADLFGGFLKAALWPEGEFGYVEPSYLLTVWARIKNSESCAIPLGLMSMPRNSIVAQNTWFPCGHCDKK